MWEVALQSLYFMMVCLSRPHEGFKPASAHFRMFWTTSGEDFVVTDGPLKKQTHFYVFRGILVGFFMILMNLVRWDGKTAIFLNRFS